MVLYTWAPPAARRAPSSPTSTCSTTPSRGPAGPVARRGTTSRWRAAADPRLRADDHAQRVLRVGGTVVLLPASSPRTALEPIQQHRVTFFGGVPTMYMALLQGRAPRHDVSSLRVGRRRRFDPQRWSIQAFKERFPASPSSRATGSPRPSPAPASTCHRPEAGPRSACRSTGRVSPGATRWARCRPGEPGEI